MMRRWSLVTGLVIAMSLAGVAAAQESTAAKATRKKLQQKVSLDLKEVGLKAFLEEINNEVDKAIKFKIDNTSGISNNMKVGFKGKGVTVEKVLNAIADKYDFGWIVVSNASNNTIDGRVLLRKAKEKERGYEAGKGPKGTSGGKESRLAPPAARLRVGAAPAVTRPVGTTPHVLGRRRT